MRSVLKSTWIACLLIAGCTSVQQTTPTQVPQPVPETATVPPAFPEEVAPPKVGLLLPLSGSAAAVGQDLLDAAQLALFDVGTSDIELLPRDTGDTPQQAVAAANAVLDAGAELLIGPLFGSAATAVAPVAATRGVHVLSFSNDASVARPGLHVLGFRPEEQIARVLTFAARQGLTRTAALAPDDAYGTRALAAWRATMASTAGGDAVIGELYAANSESPTEAVRRVAALGREDAMPAMDLVQDDLPAVPPPAAGPLPPPAYDALLIADGGPRVQAIAALLAHFRIEPTTTQLLGTMRWQDDESILRDPGLQGSWLASWPPADMARFQDRFESVYGRRPAPLAVLAYDATALAAVLGATQSRFSAEQLTDPQGFVGGAGLFRLRPDGLTDHGLSVVEVTNGTLRVVDPAPTSFTGGVAAR